MKALSLVAIIAMTTINHASATVFDFSFSGADVSGSGTFTGSLNSSGNYYDIVSASGTINQAVGAGSGMFSITGVSGYALSDDRLYYPAGFAAGPNFGDQGNTNSFLDNDGLSVTTSAGEAFNFYAQNNLYNIENSVQNVDGNSGSFTPLTQFDVNPEGASVSAVPELSTWAMMLIGFGGIGYLACRKTRNGDVGASTIAA